LPAREIVGGHHGHVGQNAVEGNELKGHALVMLYIQRVRTNDQPVYALAVENADIFAFEVGIGETVAQQKSLVAFAAISLLVSSVMISIITYASVVERTKEIGVLRSVGARKTDIMRVFNAETIIIGFAAGVFGVLVTLILSFPLSSLFKSISDGMVTVSLVSLAWWHALLLIGISVVLTTIAGMLPARSASKRDPVVALRSE
jgi:putative ABC transport system permease protein